MRARGQRRDDRRRPHPPREALDREQREIKDNVLRMGDARRGPDPRRASTALVAHDADAALAVITGDGRINEAQRHASTPDRADDRDPAARSRATCASC